MNTEVGILSCKLERISLTSFLSSHYLRRSSMFKGVTSYRPGPGIDPASSSLMSFRVRSYFEPNEGY